MTSTITRKQFTTLATVAENGPCTPRDLHYHGFESESAARSRLARLEARGFVAATYTGHHRGAGRAYVVTAKGSDALDSFTDPSDAKDR